MKKVCVIVCCFLLSTTNLFAQNYQILSKEDDAEESAGFMIVSLYSPVIDLTSDPTDAKFMKQIVGLRFNNVQIEKGADLSNCYLAFQVDKAADKNSMLSIQGEKSGKAAPFTEEAGNLSKRPKTKTRIFWNNVEKWNEPGVIKKSNDISILLEEIVNQPDWASGNSIALFIEGFGQRHATAFEKNPEFAVQLILNDDSGMGYKKPPVARAEPMPTPPPPPAQKIQPSEPVQTGICNLPEPPTGISKQAFIQGETYLKNQDFQSAEASFSMALEHLKHPKFYLYRAVTRQLLDRFDEAKSDLNGVVSAGIDAVMAQKCFNDLVEEYKNYDDVGNMFPFCFDVNVRSFDLPPCPMHVSIDGQMATLLAKTKYERTIDKKGSIDGDSYSQITTVYDWIITPGNFHPCNPNVTTKFSPSDYFNPSAKDFSMSAKTAGWFEIPIRLNYTESYIDKQGNKFYSRPFYEDWIFIGYLTKIHTGETKVLGQTIGANGKSSGGLRIE